MSIKKLFGDPSRKRNYLSDRTQKTTVADVESSRNIQEIGRKQQTFVPHVDYSEPANFAKFGSAYLYYKSSIERILDFYPYDGSEAELTKFYNDSLNIDKYIFNKKYPRTTGYVILSADAWGTATSVTSDGYGIPATAEYITFFGGPNIAGTNTTLQSMVPDPLSSKFKYNNIYDTSIYSTAGFPSDYGLGTRESNLKSNFDTGVTVEFWIQTGSLSTSLTEKQVVFDMWNNETSSSADYGRITIELDGTATGSPFLITAQSGAASASAQTIFTSSIGTDVDLSSLSDWKHYAIALYNSGSNFIAKLYVDGVLDDTNTYASVNLGELTSKNMVGRIGGLLTAPSGTAVGGTLPSSYVGGGKLSGSVDEFRFWKATRDAYDINRKWFTQIRGGVNLDISNTTLGMYYKFNEGITGNSVTDSVVLDYGGRLCNGTWTGYSTTSRNTGSAILSASAAIKEYEDPIVYAEHPLVQSLKTDLTNKGIYHDGQNTALFKNLMPSWMIEDASVTDNTDLERLSHILGTYFDTLYLQISALPSLKHVSYTSASHVALPFAQHLPQSLGLYVPDIFIDASIIEKFTNRDTDRLFEGDLTETKNLIYTNLYNNLAYIYKSKGTERAIRNTLRCFNLDDNLVSYNVYSNNQTYELKTNLKQTLKKKTFINFDDQSNLGAVVYQAADPGESDSRGYISGTYASGYEDNYGLTLEAGFTFPKFFRSLDLFDRNFITASLFGIQTANTSALTDPAFLTGAQDTANLQVYAVRDKQYSRNVYFKLTSSVDPHPFSALTSSTFMGVYDDENWNLSVRIKPSIYPLANVVSGATDYDYDVIFSGFNNKLGTVQDSFAVSSSVTKTVGQNLLRATKRVYAGARRTNITGTMVYKSDVLLAGVKYWTKYLDDASLKQHLFDRDNAGISGSYLHISPLDAVSTKSYNLNTLALDWGFENITSSDGTGNFYTTDLSSGSAEFRGAFGWVSEIGAYLHTGKGHGFDVNHTGAVDSKYTNEFVFIDPEQVVSSDMVQVLSDDDRTFGLVEQVPNYTYTIEKSLYAALTQNILDFFAGAIDFHHLIGQPVNRYRERYKMIEALRRIFFEKFQDIKTVEKFTEYYKWFDDAIALIIGQMVPGSADFVSDAYNTIESHVLERNKYKSQYPTIEFKTPLPEAHIRGIVEKIIDYEDMSSPVPSSPRSTREHLTYWRQRASSSAEEISSSVSSVDNVRTVVKEVSYSTPVLSQSMPTLTTVDGTEYHRNRRLATQLDPTVIFDTVRQKNIKGGVNFAPTKRIGYTYAALYPAGPIYNPSGGVFIPQNVLLGLTEDLVGLQELELTDFHKNHPDEKVYRTIKVQHGRDWEDGIGYANVKSTLAFPFNIISSSVISGYNSGVVARVTASVEITNLHNDVYGDDMEVPMQGPWSEYAAGGHQSRHVPLNSTAGASAATGSVTLGLNGFTVVPLDGDKIALSDGTTGYSLVFRSSPTLANEVQIEPANTFETAGYLTATINALTWNLTATDGASGVVDIQNTVLGAEGNTTITFTEAVVGTISVAGMAGGTGLNFYQGLDNYTTRPEAWKLLLGTCAGHTGAIGMVGADYPWPEANAIGETPYPMTASQKAVYYRDFVAKTPYVLRNILLTTGSTVLGNYRKNYDVVQAPGGWANPRQFVENQPVLPASQSVGRAEWREGGRSRAGIFQGTTNQATQTKTIFDIHRGAGWLNPHAGGSPSNVYTGYTGSHCEFVPDYPVAYLTKSANQTVIISKFSNPGGLEVSPAGYRDFRSDEYSVYNSTNYRNLTVIKPSQASSGTLSEPTGAGGPGVRVYDLHGYDYGLRSLTSRHATRFFRDSLWVTGTTADFQASDPRSGGPGAQYAQLPCFHRVHRNNKRIAKICDTTLAPDYQTYYLDNDKALYFGAESDSDRMLLNADSSSCLTLLTSSRANGFTYTSWISFPAGDQGDRDIFCVGKALAGDDPFIRIYRDYDGSGDRWLNLDFRTRTNDPWAGTAGLAKLSASAETAGQNLNDGEWHHIAVTIPTASTNTVGSAIGFYIDGSPVTAITGTAPTQYFDQLVQTTLYDVNGWIERDGGSTWAIGNGSTGWGNTDFSGSMDQIAIWTRALTATEVSEVYNGGIPCNITGTSAYTYDTDRLFAWYLLGEQPLYPTTSPNDIIKSTNPGLFISGTNSIFNNAPSASGEEPHNLIPLGKQGTSLATFELSTTQHPTPLAGCDFIKLLGYTETTNSCEVDVFDNLYVHHQIPRADRQYTWITGAISASDDLRYWGMMPIHGPMAGMYSSSVAGIESYMPWVTASHFGSFVLGNTSARIWGTAQNASASIHSSGSFLPTPFGNLNWNIYEPITTTAPSGSNVSYMNTLGYASGSAIPSYANFPSFIDLVNVDDQPMLFNGIILKRNGIYGWCPFTQLHQQDHPILMNEKKNNALSMIYTSSVPERMILRPLSLKGRSVKLNFDYETPITIRGIRSLPLQNATLETTYNNEFIYFNQRKLDDFLDIDKTLVGEITSFEQLVALKSEPGFVLNWIDYTECVYPALINEFSPTSSFRVGYDNKYWRNSRTNRQTLGATLSNSVGIWSALGPDFVGDRSAYRMTQSSWPLDAPLNFITRSDPPGILQGGTTTLRRGLRTSSSAGELQNTYGWWHGPSASAGWTGGTPQYLAQVIQMASSPGALYARKQTLASPLSVTIPGTIAPSCSLGSYIGGIEFNCVTDGRLPASRGAGEAYWDAPATAGYTTASIDANSATGETIVSFVSAASEPWFNDYDDFKADLKLKARGYSIIPEFRISERIEDYTRDGIASNFNTFQIPGTDRNSTEDAFYIDYSNSDFMSKFLDVKLMSGLSATEFKITCHAAIRFNPYKGFYPAQRSLDLLTQFSKSYGDAIVIDHNIDSISEPLSGANSALARMVYQPLFAPGILYNSIKSGIACDWPIIGGGNLLTASLYTGSNATNLSESNWAWYPRPFSDAIGEFITGSIWSKRLPFEAIIDPHTSMLGHDLYDMEPDPSCSFNWPVTGTLVSAPTNQLYSFMASNFTAEVGKFFLRDSSYTKLSSNALSVGTARFEGDGEAYGARLRLNASFNGQRDYSYESGATGDNTWFSKFGAKSFFRNAASYINEGTFELPQDPHFNPYFQRNFVMYSRASAFGPPISGRIPGDASGNQDSYVSGSDHGMVDSFNGFNWAYTPPHTYGEAWVDFIFRPQAEKDYDLDAILAETTASYWRFDPGPDTGSVTFGSVPSDGQYTHTLIADNLNHQSSSNTSPYNGYNINHNAMQLSSSVNLFGVENIMKIKRDPITGRVIEEESEIVGKRWVIQPKFETPMLNFAETGVHPVNGTLLDSGSFPISESNAPASSAGTKTLPLNAFGRDTAANGMWHQFGVIPENAGKGIFLQIGDIPTQWLQYHYLVASASSLYNNFTPPANPNDSTVHLNMKSFSELMGFGLTNSTAKLGILADEQTIREGIVAVPYILEGEPIPTATSTGGAGIPTTGTSTPSAPLRKSFINIPTARYDAAMDPAGGTTSADSLFAAGQSIRRLIEKMGKYVLPPQFDFLQNPGVSPIVMYIFEFEYKLDKDDLSYIWQNTAPRNYKTMSFQKDAVAHELFNTELLEESNIMENPDLRWMVFKVKQKSQSRYQEIITPQASRGIPPSVLFTDPSHEPDYPLRYNWPYDYVSIIELAKIEVEAMYKFVPLVPVFPGMGGSGGPTVLPSPPTVAAVVAAGFGGGSTTLGDSGAASEGDPAFSRVIREHLPTDWRGTSPGEPSGPWSGTAPGPSSGIVGGREAIHPGRTYSVEVPGPTLIEATRLGYGVSDGSSTISTLVRKIRTWRDGGS